MKNWGGFYGESEDALKTIPSWEILMKIGDFNAKVDNIGTTR